MITKNWYEKIPRLKREIVSAVEFIDGWATPLSKNYLKDLAYLNWLRENQRKALALMRAL